MSKPSACPYCHTEQEFLDGNREHTDEHNIVFVYQCSECGEEFASFIECPDPEYSNHTLMWTVSEGEVSRVFHIPGDEDSLDVEWKRAEFNMVGCEVYEVHGRDWAIEELFDMFTDAYDLPVAESGPVESPNNE